MGLFDRWRASARAATHPDAPRTSRSVTDVHDTDDPDLDDVVRAHLARLTEAVEGGTGPLDPQELEAVLTARLVAQRDLPDGRRYRYVGPFAPHIAEVLTLDLPMAVVTLPEERLVVGHHSVASLLSIGRRNLERKLATADVEVRALGGRRSTCTALVSDSPYTGSFARFLAEAVERFLPGSDTGNGVLFAVPDRHAVILQTCSGPHETREALEQVPAQARAFFEAGSGPVSPHVYHWYHRDVSCLTTEQPDGSLAVTTTPILDNVLGASGRRAG